MALQVEASQFWVNTYQVRDAELMHQTRQTGGSSTGAGTNSPSTLVNEIARARQQIQNSLNNEESSAGGDANLLKKISSLEIENSTLKNNFSDLEAKVKQLEARLSALEAGSGAPKATPAPAAAKPQPADDDDDDEDDFELFASDEEEDAAAEKLKQERVAAYEARKATKKQVIAKSNVILDIKPWDDETDMKAMEDKIRTIEMDGLLWGTAKLVPLAYGIKKLQISTVIEDDKVSMDEVQEIIEGFEDFVQSTDIAAFNKI